MDSASGHVCWGSKVCELACGLCHPLGRQSVYEWVRMWTLLVAMCVGAVCELARGLYHPLCWQSVCWGDKLCGSAACGLCHPWVGSLSMTIGMWILLPFGLENASLSKKTEKLEAHVVLGKLNNAWENCYDHTLTLYHQWCHSTILLQRKQKLRQKGEIKILRKYFGLHLTSIRGKQSNSSLSRG